MFFFVLEERRIVYVGRIERETSKEDLKLKFMSYGPIKQITIHYKDTGYVFFERRWCLIWGNILFFSLSFVRLKYGFVTYERAQDAFQAIDSSGRNPKINMYDISFGGRRAFCRNVYSDLGELY